MTTGIPNYVSLLDAEAQAFLRHTLAANAVHDGVVMMATEADEEEDDLTDDETAGLDELDVEADEEEDRTGEEDSADAEDEPLRPPGQRAYERQKEELRVAREKLRAAEARLTRPSSRRSDGQRETTRGTAGKGRGEDRSSELSDFLADLRAERAEDAFERELERRHLDLNDRQRARLQRLVEVEFSGNRVDRRKLAGAFDELQTDFPELFGSPVGREEEPVAAPVKRTLGKAGGGTRVAPPEPGKGQLSAQQAEKLTPEAWDKAHAAGQLNKLLGI